MNTPYPLAKIRADFPILAELARGKRLAYLDNGATTQKPQSVIDATSHYYQHSNANVHRAVHDLAERATNAFEQARDRIAAFVGAAREEVVFTRGTTEGINLVAYSFVAPQLKAGDEIIITGMEHHSNIVPWQLISERVGARIVVVPVLDDGSLDLDAWRAAFTARTVFAAATMVSNTLGTVNPVTEMLDITRAHGVPVLLDAAQAVAHMPLAFSQLGADFVVFSSHKLFGPTGFGCLLGKRALLNRMPPWHGGGDMIKTVTFAGSTYADAPYRFEAGTPDIAGAIGLAAAVDYVHALGLDAIATHEHQLLEYATHEMQRIAGLRILGTAPGKSAIISFLIEGAPAQDVGSILDMEGVAVRTGHHCTMPLMARFGVSSTTRASFACYNGLDDVDQLIAGLRKAQKMLC